MRKLAATAVLLMLLTPAAQALTPRDVLSLVAMPLAVAAVSEITGVPLHPLATLATTLNQAYVPPVEFVEVMRYAPVVLLAPDGTRFVQLVQTEAVRGVRGPALVDFIEQRLPTYGIPATEFVVVESEPFYDPYFDEAYFPAVVRQRISDRSSHPHGGPPGQLKKELGLQTGGEVVHGTSRGDRVADDRRPKRDSRADRDDDPVRRVVSPRVERQRVERVERERGPKRDRSEASGGRGRGGEGGPPPHAGHGGGGGGNDKQKGNSGGGGGKGKGGGKG